VRSDLRVLQSHLHVVQRGLRVLQSGLGVVRSDLRVEKCHLAVKRSGSRRSKAILRLGEAVSDPNKGARVADKGTGGGKLGARMIWDLRRSLERRYEAQQTSRGFNPTANLGLKP